jgi:hypothetical protein
MVGRLVMMGPISKINTETLITRSIGTWTTPLISEKKIRNHERIISKRGRGEVIE